MQVLTLLRVEEQEQAEVVEAFRRTLQELNSLHDTNTSRWQDMIRFILGWASHRRPPEERPLWWLLAEEMQANEQRKNEVKAMHMTIADEIRLEGKAEGKAEGRVEGVRALLLRLGAKIGRTGSSDTGGASGNN